MPRGVNKVILIGNTTSDPEVRYTANGNAVCNITIATNEEWKDRQTGEKKEKAEFHRVVLFGKLAEIAGQYLKKGSKVYIEGKLETRKWTNKEGQDVYTTEIKVDIQGQMQMLDSAEQGGEAKSFHEQRKPIEQRSKHSLDQAQKDDDEPPF